MENPAAQVEELTSSSAHSDDKPADTNVFKVREIQAFFAPIEV